MAAVHQAAMQKIPCEKIVFYRQDMIVNFSLVPDTVLTIWLIMINQMVRI